MHYGIQYLYIPLLIPRRFTRIKARSQVSADLAADISPSGVIGQRSEVILPAVGQADVALFFLPKVSFLFILGVVGREWVLCLHPQMSLPLYES